MIISPVEAVEAGAQWRLLSGVWQNSGAIINDLEPGKYNIEFKSVLGWDTPADLSVTIEKGKVNSRNVIYTRSNSDIEPEVDSLIVNIYPEEAVNAGAKWRADDGPWYGSGEMVQGFSKGPHIISFSDLEGWNSPDEIAITLGQMLPGGAGIRLLPESENPGQTTYTSKPATLVFPHVVNESGWTSEICIINTDSSESISGNMLVYNAYGSQTDVCSIELAPGQRKSFNQSDNCPWLQKGRYVIFEAPWGASMAGYTQINMENKNQDFVPASTSVDDNNYLYIPHIASNPQWATGIALLNQMNETRETTIRFNNGSNLAITLEPFVQKAFTVKSLFNGEPQLNLESAVIENASGITGIILFNDLVMNRMTTLSLNQKTATELYFPIVARNNDWYSSLALFNPLSVSTNLNFIFYDQKGNELGEINQILSGNERYVGMIKDIEMPEETSWFKVDSDHPIIGFEILGTLNSDSMAGFSAVQPPTGQGVFPKLEKDGWSSLILLNIEDEDKTVSLKAMDDNGNLLATHDHGIQGKSQITEMVEDLFPGQDISGATYVSFSSDGELISLQLNLSEDREMLGAIPGLE